MPALDFTAWPSKPAAPPAGSSGAPRQTARANAPKAGPKGAKAGSPGGGDGEFGSLVDRLADDAPEEGRTSAAGGSTRRSREVVTDGEERAAEPRAKKGDAEQAAGTANDAPASVAASTQPAFPWTLPLNPSLWNIEQVQVEGESTQETGDAIDDSMTGSVIGAATAAIADSASGACVATLPGATDAETSAAYTVPVEMPIAVHPATTASAASSAAPVEESHDAKAKDDAVIDANDTFAWTAASLAGAAGTVSTGAAANVTGTAGEQLAGSNGIARAGQADAALANDPIGGAGFDSAIGQSALDALTTNQLEHPSSSVDPNDSALLAQSAMHAATMAAAVDGSAATTAAERTGQANAAIDGPLPGDQAREQALMELQRALESARANAPAAPAAHAANAERAGVIDTGLPGAAALDDTAAAIDAAAAEAGADSGFAIAAAGEAAAGTSPIASATSASSRSREAREAAEDSENDDLIGGVSSWAAAAAAKYAEAAGGSASSGSGTGTGTRDSGANADAAASLTVASRASGDASGIAPVGFDARVLGASRAENAASELPAWTGEPVVTTAAPEEQAAQIVRSMRLKWRGQTGEATLRLQPDHLGNVFVSVRVDQGTVSAMVRAETPAAQQWIQQHQQQLRDALDAQGLRVAEFQVTSNPDDRPRRDNQQDQNEDAAGRRFRPRARQNGSDDRRFEILL